MYRYKENYVSGRGYRGHHDKHDDEHDDTHDGKHEYKHGGNYDHAHPIHTPFAQDKKWGSGKKCYQKCKDTCVDYYDYTQLAKEPGYWPVGGTTGGVQCKVAYADHVQYGGVSSTYVAAG